MKLGIYILGRFSKKSSNIEFHGNPSSGSKDVPCGQAGRKAGRQTDMTKLMVAFCNFENMLKDGFQDSTGASEHWNH